MAQPEATRAGIPIDLAITTNAVLKTPHEPSRCSKRNQSTGSLPGGGASRPDPSANR